MRHGKATEFRASNETSQPYKFSRYFSADNKKYCYKLNTAERRRYIVRATFLYGDSDSADNAYPMFQLYLDATQWSTVTIKDASRIYVEELIIRAPSSSIQVCVCCASTSYPFITTLELRPLNLSLYATEYEDEYFLKVAARVNFGALSSDPIRYPDDPYDRIWESDLVKRQNYLVGMAPGTKRINTSKMINTNLREHPPVKVMQTAVVGTKDRLTYRLDLEGFPANARAYAYFAEIEDLKNYETRKFTLRQPYLPGYSNVIVNIAENANGSYTLYEPSYMNISLDFVLSFALSKTQDSTCGPLLNAIEVSKYVKIFPKTDTQDAANLDFFHSMSLNGEWKYEDGDPCNPIKWEWVNCSTSTPPRITKIVLSGKNLSGVIPSEIAQLDQLTELWLDGNSLSGSIPDMSSLISLTIVHLENNNLAGQLPSYFGELPNLRELYVQNNCLSGDIPPALLNGKIIFNYADNPRLNIMRNNKKNPRLILFSIVTALVVFVFLLLGSLWWLWKRLRNMVHDASHEKSNSLRIISKSSIPLSMRAGSSVIDEALDLASYVTFAEIEEATCNFSKKIGEGSFGPVYYGKMKDGKEVAVKISADSSIDGTRQFTNEVALLSRIHHKNLVPLIGYCEEGCKQVLVYEYMHNGTLRDHLHDLVKKRSLDWLSRLLIAEDAAKGLAYLHNGCNPSVIHRDVKTSNILLDINMRAKVSDFGLSRQANENLSHISSVARGTVGYLDPEYYATQQLTDKSDVYSFGVVLLEIISGKSHISIEDYGPELNIVHWARSLIRKGDIASIIDPSFMGAFKIESVWRVAETAFLSVELHGASRPRMQEVEIAIHDAIEIEKGSASITTIESSSSSSALANHLEFLSSSSSNVPFAR
ncbi:Non-specific serine/threonine protein kinase protein [Dioscorea alata]|nr:Non-specific serine/threonine protein kinase protein [Dioscorea alata]KAH7681498.1 Non-specific serine/threonine protein kinase protein [Dioscorea alata]KAH7681499.1 Non-specific serine/threonine protein kinase protein [Dioscorea alata]KAH7681500.1 Non-specific serine/threonine protein kinase protein [Dioscorea alata]KAH7681501.1 Non-specific serine/threonine protein kinase protein [Dioscorea alata]